MRRDAQSLIHASSREMLGWLAVAGIGLFMAVCPGTGPFGPVVLGLAIVSGLRLGVGVARARHRLRAVREFEELPPMRLLQDKSTMRRS